jgi:glutaminyl-peptide cyclotransferase
MTNRTKTWLGLFGFIFLISGTLFLLKQNLTSFSGDRALEHVLNQVALGPRTPGSHAHSEVISYISNELKECEWEAEIQESTFSNHEIKNIIARRGSIDQPLILGAHYDSRLMADNDSDLSKRALPVPGANDGASGVAILLELGCTLPDEIASNLWLVFFDLEDQGKIESWDWILGSRAFVNDLNVLPEAVVIVDMVGDTDLNIFMESNSDPEINSQIWLAAKKLDYEDFFISEGTVSILDDHTPFIEKGIRAVDIIDFKYPYWHTTEDTSDKVTAQSLEIVGKTLEEWLTNFKP